MTQEIIGSEPSISEIKIIFEKELIILIKNLESTSKENLKNLERDLKNFVFGQNRAIEELSSSIKLTVIRGS